MRKNHSVIFGLLYILALLVVIILPLIIWRLKLPIVEATYDGSTPGTLASQPFELFIFLITILFGAITWLKIVNQSHKSLETVVPIILPFLVCLNFAFIQVETFYAKSSDYMCYENAARAILAGANPYAGIPPCYLYPPLLAQVLASLHQIAVYNPLFAFTNETQAWTAVTYFYQCGQFLQVILAYYLTFLLARDLRIKSLPASWLVAALLLFNYPLVRTLTFDQINLWILNSFLLSIVLLRRYSILSGLAVALGAYIKLYTLILLLPWSFTRRWQAILGTIAGFAGIALIQTNWGRDWGLWQQFLTYFRSPEKPTNYRNDSLWSLVFNSAKIPARLLHADALLSFVPIVVAVLNLLIVLWFALRFIQRERIYTQLNVAIANRDSNSWSYIYRFYGHSMDAIALSLLISPSVWEHHYVIALPIALWAIATRGLDQPWFTSIGIFLIFCISTFEVFPLSFHRLVGLLIIICITDPRAVQNYFLKQSRSLS